MYHPCPFTGRSSTELGPLPLNLHHPAHYRGAGGTKGNEGPKQCRCRDPFPVQHKYMKRTVIISIKVYLVSVESSKGSKYRSKYYLPLFQAMALAGGGGGGGNYVSARDGV